MTETLLEVRNLFGGYKRGVDVLHDLSFSVSGGEALGMIGLNGSGKSTLGRALMNLLPYRSGEVFFDGTSVNCKSTHELCREGLTMMHQGGAVFPNLSVWENLRLASGQQNPIVTERIESLIPLLSRPRTQLRRMMADKLSEGERHQLALAMALSANPKLVILDEPSAGLSPSAVDSMYKLLSEITKSLGTSIILIEQNITRAVAFCDRCVLMEGGRLFSDLDNLSLEEIETKLFKNK